jgi:Cu/Ag efflux protein CusF
MNNKSILALALAVALSPAVIAQTAAPQAAVLAASAPGKAAVAGTVTVTATVVAIDVATRTLTLKGAGGKIADVTVPPEAKNFDKIKVGDLVTVEYVRALTLELMPAGGGIRSASSQAASAPAPAGAVAGGAMGKQVVIMANVTAVNTKAGIVTLRGPKGNSVDLEVKDPAQLKRVKVGDQVEAVYTEAMAITVDHAPKPAKK